MLTHSATRGRVAPARTALIAVLTLLLSLTQIAAAVAAPDNDDFASARTAAPLPYLAQQGTGDATTDDADPYQFGSGATVWYRFTAPADTVLVAETVGSDYDTTLGAYTGATPGALTEVAINDDAVGLQSRIAFRATAGITYHFMVGAYGGGPGGGLSFRLAAAPAPGNDAYAQAVEIPEPLPFFAEQGTLGATPSPDDPACAAGGPSVWYRFTPTQDVQVTADAFGSDYVAALSVVTGAPGSFAEVVCQPEGGTVNFAARAGVTYYLLSTPVEPEVLGGTVRISVRQRVVRYAARELPTPAGFAFASGNALNNGGTAVGQAPAPTVGNRGVVWVDGQPVVFGVLGPSPGGFFRSSAATAINESGTVVGTTTSPGGNRAAVFLPNGGVVDLGVLGQPPIGQPSSAASGINNSGLIVGTSSSPGGNRAVAWRNGKIADLGFLGLPAFGAPFSVARAVNNRGMIVGSSSSPAGVRAALWYKGEIVDLGVLGAPRFGTAVSQAYAVNNPGEVVGNSTSPAGTRGFFWDRGDMTPLGILPEQEPNSEGSAVALGINGDRVIVGNSTWIGGQRAVVWTGPSSPAEDLNDLVPPLPVALFDARAVNDDGVILAVGGGRTYLLTPVNP